MNYLAILDYEHLDNAIFLKSFAEAIAAQNNTRGIILHGDSQYTDRLIQTGMLSDEARLRSIKDLNHRLVSLMADSGVAVVGVNAYQRNIISYNGSALKFDRNFLTKFPAGTHLLLSNLVDDERNQKPIAYNLAGLANNLFNELELDEIFIFSAKEADEIITQPSKPEVFNYDELDENFKDTSLPEDLHDLAVPFRLTTTRSFREIPNLADTILIR
ncbi:MAG: hypothetical protein WEB89_06050 [Balneolales bacterium]